MSQHLLLIEDEPKLRLQLVELLEGKSFTKYLLKNRK